MIYKVDDKFYACMVRGDREVNEYKISRLLNAVSVEMATAEEDEKITGANVGFAGPIDLSIPVIIDNEVLCMKNFLVGANKSDYHYINTNLNDLDENKPENIHKNQINGPSASDFLKMTMGLLN